MKKLLIIILLASIALTTLAQKSSEMVKQKKTQKRYLIEQIVALQIYIGYVKKGYSIAREGLNAISSFKRGEFKLHTDYFNSLKMVNPKIKDNAQIAEILTIQLIIIQDCISLRKQVRKNGAFNKAELEYTSKVLGRLLDYGIQTLDELITVTTDGRLEMKDDERLMRINQLYQDIKGQYMFVQSFRNEMMIVALSRIKEINEVQTSRSIYGIKNN